MKKSDIAVLGLSRELSKLWEDYIAALQVDKDGDDLHLLARFMIAANRDNVDFDGSHVDIVLPVEVWGHDIPPKIVDFVDAMAALLGELNE